MLKWSGKVGLVKGCLLVVLLKLFLVLLKLIKKIAGTKTYYLGSRLLLKETLNGYKGHEKQLFS